MKEPVLSAVAIAYAKRHAAKLFEGRRGHGSGGISRRVLSRAELEDNLAVAFELGQQLSTTISRVKS